MAQAIRKQDLPPPNGYQSIPHTRMPAKTYFKGTTMFAGFIGVTAVSIYLFKLNLKRNKHDEIEMRSAKMAITPLLIAERDREFLKQLSRNRDAEAKLMANVEGWEVGTWYGEPVYKTLPPDEFVNPIFHEFYAHASIPAWRKRTDIKLMS